MCIALLLPLSLLFELVKLNFLFLLVVPDKLEEQREELTALSKLDPPGQRCQGRACSQFIGILLVMEGLPVLGVNEGLLRG